MCACMRVGMTGTPGTASSVVSRSREAAPKASPHSRHQSPSLPQRSVAVPSSAALDPVCARACVRACHAMRGSSRRRARPPALSGRRASYETPPAHTGLHQTRLNQTSRSAHRRRAHLADQGTHTPLEAPVPRCPRPLGPPRPRAGGGAARASGKREDATAGMAQKPVRKRGPARARASERVTPAHTRVLGARSRDCMWHPWLDAEWLSTNEWSASAPP